MSPSSKEPDSEATQGASSRARDRDVILPGRGTTLIHEVSGPADAPTLFLLHGLAATGRLNWFPSLGALSEHYNIVVVDHRGHGRGIRTNHFRLVDCADDVVALADHLGIESFLAVGYSMGGPIAKLCWSRHPDRVRGLVLCATAKHFLPLNTRGIASAVFPGVVLSARLMPDAFRKRIVDGMLEGVPPGKTRDWIELELSSTDPATVMQATRAVIRFSSHDWVSNINVPTAVVVTTKDRLVPTPRQHELAASIPGAKVFEVEADHLACVGASGRFVPSLVQACQYVAEESQAVPGR